MSDCPWAWNVTPLCEMLIFLLHNLQRKFEMWDESMDVLACHHESKRQIGNMLDARMMGRA